ncbi:MAG: hypothetical protein JSW66_20495 [Phycisphaerales bacterium]|nr:MAG: hypothetical protein JSW66_20495 [Phycisphaerales bacterium]
MAEPEKNKAGLQKKVSSVFKGVPLPQNSGVPQTPGTPASDPTPGASAQPPSVDHQAAQSSLLKKLQQTEDTSDNALPDTTAAASPEPAPAERQRQQHSELKKQHQAGASSKEALSAKRPEGQMPQKAAGPSLWQQINNRLFPQEPGGSSTRQKAMVILVPVLAIIMIFMFRQVLSTSPRQTQAATDEGSPVVAAAAPGHEIDWQIPDPLPAIGRDPIKLPDQVVSTTAEPNEAVVGPATEIIDIRDIVYSKDKPSAVINAHIVYVGHKVAGATVVQILRDGVEFEKDGKKWVQRIGD